MIRENDTQFNIGDRVMLRSKPTEEMVGRNHLGFEDYGMSEWINRVMTINNISTNSPKEFEVEENNWCWDMEWDFVKINTTF